MQPFSTINRPFLSSFILNEGQFISQFYTGYFNRNKVKDYFPYGKVLREFSSTPREKYILTHHERDQETGLDHFDYRNYDSDIGRFLSIDPLAQKAPAWTPFRAFFDNPVRFVDPSGLFEDDITINSDGVVTNVVKTDKPNRFFDEEGNELKLNDGEKLDAPMLSKEFKEGDKIFETITRAESEKELKDVGDIRFDKVTPFVNHQALFFAFRYALASYSEYDFGWNYLKKRLNASDSQMRNLYWGTGYSEGLPFVRFEGSNTLYNLPDAGNFLWGKKAADNKLTKSLMLRGAGANEGGSDTKADTRAILSGFNY